MEKQHRKWVEERWRAIENCQIVEGKGIDEDPLQQLGWRDIMARRG